ncbi:MAG: hypothetical protein WB767_09945 [Nocardioides sp.]
MHARRTTTVLALFVAVTLVASTLLVSSATARSSATAAAAPAAPAERAQAQPKIGIKIIKRGGKLVMVGNVRPPKGPLVVQKATTCNARKGTCDFKGFKKVPVRDGRYQARVFAPTKGSWAWRAKVGNAVSEIWVTCKKLSADNPCPTP